MKRLSDQTLYEILEVAVDAPADEIARAYERARSLYGPGSLATYTLASPEEAAMLTSRIEEARAVLLDAEARARYDQRIGLPPAAGEPAAPAVPWPAPLPPAATPVPPPATASSTAPSPPEPPARAWPATPPPGPATTPPELAPAAAAVVVPAPAEPAGVAPLPPAPVVPPELPEASATAAPPPLAPPAQPIPLRQEIQAPRDVLVPEGTAWTGEVLRRVREARGLTVKQVSERTKVTRHHIENIEADRYGALPAPVYLRGIIVSMARELRLDGQRVARSYLEQVAAAQASPDQPKR